MRNARSRDVVSPQTGSTRCPWLWLDPFPFLQVALPEPSPPRPGIGARGSLLPSLVSHGRQTSGDKVVPMAKQSKKVLGTGGQAWRAAREAGTGGRGPTCRRYVCSSLWAEPKKNVESEGWAQSLNKYAGAK